MTPFGRQARVGMLLCVALFACTDGRSAAPDGGLPVDAPHIVLILADDLGWLDVSFHLGGLIATPNIDRIAAEGVQLDRFLTAPVCSPTRMGLLTGRYPIRWGMQRTVVRPWDTLGLPNEEQTLPEVLATVGYGDRAIMGKWHVGQAKSLHHPLSHGFTEFYGSYNGAILYTDKHLRNGERDWHRDYTSVPEDDGEYITQLVGRAAADFIVDHANAHEPFLLYLPFQAPHAPFEAPEACQARHPDLQGRERVYAGMVSCLDDAVGEVLSALDETGLSRNTLVIFISDNGGVFGNGPWREGKADVFEGGVRVSAAVRWPAGEITGGRSISTMMGYLDVLPTLGAAAGVTTPPLHPLDGRNMLPILRGDEPSSESEPREWFAYVVEHDSHRLSVTEGAWKLVWRGPDPAEEPNPEKAEVYLFNLDLDPAEEKDRSRDEPERAADMLERLRGFRAMQPEEALEFSIDGPAGWKPPPDWELPEP